MFMPKSDTYVDGEIKRTVSVLKEKQPDSKEYAEVLNRLGSLQKIRQEEKPATPSSDTIITAAAHLIGIFLILRHENLNMITSKALQFVPRPR